MKPFVTTYIFTFAFLKIYKQKNEQKNDFVSFLHVPKKWNLESMKQIELTKHCVCPSVFPAVKINCRIKWKVSAFN